MAGESKKTVPEMLREEAERDFTLVRETLRRRYEHMGRRILRKSDVARVLQSGVDPDDDERAPKQEQ